MELPQAIRSKISQLDDLSREIEEEIREFYEQTEEPQVEGEEWDKHFITEARREDFRYAMADIQDKVTAFQEGEGWIDSDEE